MASLKKFPKSPFWYIRQRNLDTGKWVDKPTGLRVGNESENRKAQRMADAASARERRIGGPGSSGAFLAWVPGYMATHWQGGGSPKRYRAAWFAVSKFLAEQDVVYPRQIRYEHGEAYLEWRQRTKVFGHKVSRNTAILELKFLAQLVSEAVRRGHAETNPLRELRISRDAAKPKREFSEDDIKKLRAALKTQPEWMRTAFEISLHTGCRFNECSIPFDKIDFKNNTISLRDSKRKETDPRAWFTVPLHPGLRPLLLRLKKTGAAVTCTLSDDKNGRINKVIKKTVGDDSSFHCLRVTFVTRCQRAGLSESITMRLVNHSSQLVHRIYAKLGVDDLRKAQGKIKIPR